MAKNKKRRTVKEEYRELRKALERADELYKDRVDRIKEKIKKLRSECGHSSRTFHSDPAGDTSESFHKCDDCGFEE